MNLIKSHFILTLFSIGMAIRKPSGFSLVDSHSITSSPALSVPYASAIDPSASTIVGSFEPQATTFPNTKKNTYEDLLNDIAFVLVFHGLIFRF